jgi:hypothetical protein
VAGDGWVRFYFGWMKRPNPSFAGTVEVVIGWLPDEPDPVEPSCEPNRFRPLEAIQGEP